MASRALTARLTITCSNCEMSALTGHRSRPCTTSSVTFSPISRRSSMLRSLKHLAEIEHLRAQRLLAREGQQMPHQARRAVGILLDLHDVAERRIGRLVRVEQEVGRHDDGGEHVVEVVSDAAGELADELHLLLLGDLGLELALRGGLERVDDGGFLVALLLLDRGDIEAAEALAVTGKRRVDRRNVALAAAAAWRSRSRARRDRARRRRRRSSGLPPVAGLSAFWNSRANSGLVRTIRPLIDGRDRHRRVVEEAHEANFGGALRIGAVVAARD